MRTFEIKSEFFKLEEMMNNDLIIVDEESGEVIEDNTNLLEELLAELTVSRDEKLENIEYIKRDLKIREDALKEEAKRLSERAKMISNNIEKLKGLQDFILSGEKVKTDKFTFFYAKSESVNIFDDKSIPSEYIKFDPKIDKSKIKQDLKNGIEINGAKIEENISLRIR